MCKILQEAAICAFETQTKVSHRGHSQFSSAVHTRSFLCSLAVQMDAQPGAPQLYRSDSSWQDYLALASIKSDANPESAPESITVADALQAIRNDRALTQAAQRIPFPVIYFAVYIFMVFVHLPATDLYKQSNALYTTLATTGESTITQDSPMQFFNIQTQSDVFSWLERTLVPSVFVTQGYNGQDLPNAEWGRVATYNQVLGAVRYSSSVSSEASCDNQEYLHAIYSTCHNLDSTEDNVGFLGFDLNASQAIKQIEKLKNASTLVNNSVTSLEIDVVSYNGEVSAFAVTTLTLEFQEGGFIKPKATTIPAKSRSYEKIRPYVADFLVVSCFLLVLRRQFVVLWKQRLNLFDHITDFWVLFDYASSLLVVAFYAIWSYIIATTMQSSFRERVQNLSTGGLAWDTDDDANRDLNEIISSLKEVADWTVVLRLVATATIACLGVCILERFRFHPRLNAVSKTLAHSLTRFGAFFIVCGIVIVIFAVSGHVIFGDRAHEFYTVPNALKSCINMMLQVFDYSKIDGLHGAIATIYYWSYMIIVTILLLNMMFAIVLETYQEVSDQAFLTKGVTPVRRIMKNACYDTVMWLHDSIICSCFFRARQDAPLGLLVDGKDVVSDPRGLVFLGRVRPDVLEATLCAILSDHNQSDASTQLTSESLKSMFVADGVSEEQAQATIDHLGHGVLHSKKSERARMNRRERKTLLHDLSEASKSRDTLSNVEDVAVIDRIHAIEQRLAQMDELERKLDLLVQHVLK